MGRGILDEKPQRLVDILRATTEESRHFDKITNLQFARNYVETKIKPLLLEAAKNGEYELIFTFDDDVIASFPYVMQVLWDEGLNTVRSRSSNQITIKWD